MDKNEIMILDCYSSGFMYIDEIIERGYKAFVINTISNSDHLETIKKNCQTIYENKYSNNTDIYECINVSHNVDEVIKNCKGHNIVACVLGNEFSADIIDETAYRLGLLGNDPKTSHYRYSKLGMIEALEKNGIRTIKSKKIQCEEDIKKFFNGNGIKKAIMKFTVSAGGEGNKICGNVDEALDYYKTTDNVVNYYGNKDNEVIIQEYIEGPEYVVNTVSCDGVHLLTDIWRYGKISTNDGYTLSHTSTLIHKIDNETEDLVKYAYEVLDATNVKYGPVHGEYKIDEKGPVLIEVNCRPMGGSTTREYAKAGTGNCIVDWSLDALLDKETFLSRKLEYKSKCYAEKKYIILYDDIEGDLELGLCLSEKFKTFFDHYDYVSEGHKKYLRTKNLASCPLIVKLASDKYDDIKYDVELFSLIEKEYPKLFVYDQMITPEGKQESLDDIASKFDHETLVFTDKGLYLVSDNQYVPYKGRERFKQVYFANAKSELITDKVNNMFEMFNYLQEGGTAICSDCVSEHLPYKQDFFKIIKKIARI